VKESLLISERIGRPIIPSTSVGEVSGKGKDEGERKEEDYENQG